MPTTTTDYAALTAPISRAELRAFKAELKASGRAPGGTTSSTVIGIVALVVLGTPFLGFAIYWMVSIADDVISSRTSSPLPIVFPIVFFAMATIILVTSIRTLAGGGGKWRRWYRLDRFARSNRLTFAPLSRDPQFPGSVFTIGDTRQAFDHLYRDRGRFLDFGNYRYSTGSGRSRTTSTWGFLALKLDRALPNIVLDAKSNNALFGVTNLPNALSSSQRLSLEGDFDRHFTLYCPKGYQTDALYIFTPDLMALLIDQASSFDVEIVDEWMFVYSAKPFTMTDPATVNHLLRIADTVGAKTLRQTERYSDDRIGNPRANLVAPEGRRLTQAFPVLGTIMFCGLVAFWIANLMHWI